MKYSKVSVSRKRYEQLLSAEGRVANLEDELKSWRAEYAQLSQVATNTANDLCQLRNKETEGESQFRELKNQVAICERAMAKLIEQKERDGQTIAILVRQIELINSPQVTVARPDLALADSLHCKPTR